MTAAVEDARRGAGRVLGVLGEAGIGKSALLDAAAERARDAGLLVIDGRGVEHERDVPFGLAHTALLPTTWRLCRAARSMRWRRASTALSCVREPDGAPAERFHLHRAARALLELLGRRRPLALLLDDLHWADEASIELVLHLLRRPPASAHLLAFARAAGRPGAAAARRAAQRPRLRAARRSSRSGTTHRSRCWRACADAALRERLAREAAGNPLFLRELARAADRRTARCRRRCVAAVEQEVAALPARRRARCSRAPRSRATRSTRSSPPPPPASSATPAALDRLVAAGLVRADRATAARSRSAIRSSAARSTTARRPAGGWARTSARRAALERRGAAAGACAPTTSSAPRGRATRRRSRCSARPRRPRPAPRRRRRALVRAPRCASCPTATASGAAACCAARAALAAAGRLAEARDALARGARAHPGERRLGSRRLRARRDAARPPCRGAPAAARRARDAPPEDRAALAFELADGRVQHRPRGGSARLGRARGARGEGGGHRSLLAGAEALAALGRMWAGDPRPPRRCARRARRRGSTARRRRARRRALDGPMLVGVAQILCERFAARVGDERAALAIARRTRPGAGARDAARAARDVAAGPARPRRRARARRRRRGGRAPAAGSAPAALRALDAARSSTTCAARPRRPSARSSKRAG